MKQSRSSSGMTNGHTRQKGFLTSRQALVVLLLIFMGPAFVALVMHRVGDGSWQPEGTTNSGTLVHPARPLSFSEDLVVNDGPLATYLQGKWTLLYIGDSECSDTCRHGLYKTRQSRIAQNEKMKRVQRLFVVQDGVPGPELTEFLQTEHPQLDIFMPTAEQFSQIATGFAIDETPAAAAQRIYIIDPLGNLMMFYSPDADARGLIKDLRKLLKFSRIG